MVYSTKNSCTNLTWAFFLCTLLFTMNLSSEEDSKAYANLCSTATQISGSSSEFVCFEHISLLSGLKFKAGHKIVIKKSGTYFIMATANAGSKQVAPVGNVSLWLCKNGVPMLNTLSQQFVNNNSAFYPLLSQTITQLKENDVINVGFKASAVHTGLIPATLAADFPKAPSASLTIYQIN